MEEVKAEVKVKTEAELVVELQAASAAGDMKKVIELAGEIKKLRGEQEKKDKAATVGKIDALAKEMGPDFDEWLEDWMEKIKAVVPADKISINIHAEPGVPATVKLAKSSPKLQQRSGVTAPAKKFDLGTDELLNLYGGEEYKDGKTYKDIYDASTDKNHRFAVRKALITRHIKSNTPAAESTPEA